MHGYTRTEFIGLNPAVFMPPESHALFKENVRVAEPGSVFKSLIVHKRRDGSLFYVEVRRSAIDYRGRPCLLSVIRDVSKRIQTEKILGRQIEVQMHEQATLLAISHTLASTIEFQPGLILEQLREIIEYTHCGLFTLQTLHWSPWRCAGIHNWKQPRLSGSICRDRNPGRAVQQSRADPYRGCME